MLFISFRLTPSHTFSVASAVSLRRLRNFCQIFGLLAREIHCYIHGNDSMIMIAVGLRRLFSVVAVSAKNAAVREGHRPVLLAGTTATSITYIANHSACIHTRTKFAGVVVVRLRCYTFPPPLRMTPQADHSYPGVRSKVSSDPV